MSGTYLITGAAGFIGSHLAARLLKEGAGVIGVDNFDAFYGRALKEHNLAQIKSPQFRFVEADIRDGLVMTTVAEETRPDCIVHIAALAGVRPSIADPARYVSVNLDGLASVLDAARAANCRRILFASSSSVYGDNTKVPFSEDDPVDDPISPYAATKRAGELICRVYCERYGLTILPLRFFTVYGPAQRPDLAICTFMDRIARDEEIPMYGDGSTSRDYTYIDDIIAGMLAADRRAVDSPEGFFRIYNLGGSQPVTLAEMIRSIAEVVGREPRIRQLPLQPGDVQRTYADLTRSEAELGYRPATPFMEGLRRQWEWMKAHRPAARLSEP